MKKEKLFTRENKKAVIRSDSKTQHITYDNDRRTYKAVYRRGRVNIYEVFRKKKSVRVVSYKSKDLDKSIGRFNKSPLSFQIVETYKRDQIFSTKKSYQNFKPTKAQLRGKQKKVVMQLLCFCVAPKQRIQDYIVGYSKSFSGRGSGQFERARKSAIQGARAGFINKYNRRLSSGSDIIVKEIERRYIIYADKIRKTKMAKELMVR